MSSLLIILFAILETRFADCQFVRNWAMTIINRIESPQLWLFELDGCIDLNKMKDVLRLKAYDEGMFFDEHYERLCLGFLFLRYEGGDIGYVDLEGEVADILDACNGFDGIDIEYVQEFFASEKSLFDLESGLVLLLKNCAQEARLGLAYISGEEVLVNRRVLLSS